MTYSLFIINHSCSIFYQKSVSTLYFDALRCLALVCNALVYWIGLLFMGLAFYFCRVKDVVKGIVKKGEIKDISPFYLFLL
jgi:hypothetical protein